MHYDWRFGYLTLDSKHFPGGLNNPGRLCYKVYFHKGKVSDFAKKEDPFDGRFSPDGLPMVPKLISPSDNTTFSHYPRYVDLRWCPSSGDYPMTYEIEFHGCTMKTDIPFATVLGRGQGEEQWRVRAINAKGTSEWSEYFTLHFEN